MAEREREFRDGRSLEIRGDMTQPREVRIVEEPPDEGPDSYSAHVKSPTDHVLVVTHYRHVPNEDGEEEAIPYEEHEFDSGNAFLHHIRKITNLPSGKLKR